MKAAFTLFLPRESPARHHGNGSTLFLPTVRRFQSAGHGPRVSRTLPTSKPRPTSQTQGGGGTSFCKCFFYIYRCDCVGWLIRIVPSTLAWSAALYPLPSTLSITRECLIREDLERRIVSDACKHHSHTVIIKKKERKKKKIKGSENVRTSLADLARSLKERRKQMRKLCVCKYDCAGICDAMQEEQMNTKGSAMIIRKYRSALDRHSQEK